MLDVETVATDELGDRSYVVHDGQVAIVIDPQRDIDRVEAVLVEKGLTCALVLETHVHNDYVSGGLELSRRTGATYCVAADEDVEYERLGVADGDELSAGTLHVKVVATPGHTDGHVSYLVDDSQTQGASVAFTGGSLLYGSVGRTDLVDPRRTEELTRAQYHSVRRLAGLLDDETPVFPTHGFGSFCSSGSAVVAQAGTVGAERARNDALVIDDEDEFVARLVAGLTSYPRYYARMAPMNRRGPAPVDLSPPEPVDPDQLAERIGAGEWVVDLRTGTAFAAEHLDGTIGIPLGLQFATYLGWLLPDGTPLTLLGESKGQVADALRQLVRIGIDRPGATTMGSPREITAGTGLRSYPTASFADLERTPDAVVLDVRLDSERRLGFSVGKHHVPLHVLLDRIDDIPDGRIWVHCVGGYRASIAASLLDRAGRDVVLIDDHIDHAPAGRYPGFGIHEHLRS